MSCQLPFGVPVSQHLRQMVGGYINSICKGNFPFVLYQVSLENQVCLNRSSYD